MNLLIELDPESKAMSTEDQIDTTTLQEMENVPECIL